MGIPANGSPHDVPDDDSLRCGAMRSTCGREAVAGRLPERGREELVGMAAAMRPCSAIHRPRAPERGPALHPDHTDARWLEIWNWFMDSTCRRRLTGAAAGARVDPGMGPSAWPVSSSRAATTTHLFTQIHERMRELLGTIRTR